MNRLIQKQVNQNRRSNRVRSRVSGTSGRPRLAVYISNQHVTAQIIDDEQAKTLVYASSAGRKLEGTMSEKAALVGGEIAQKAKKAKITKVALDRGYRKYHGRLKDLADSARKEGLEF